MSTVQHPPRGADAAAPGLADVAHDRRRSDLATTGPATTGPAAADPVATDPVVIDVQVPNTLYARGGKRCADLVVALAALVLLSPVLVAVALVIRRSLGKGILYKQSRVGLHGEDFEMLKFRTMKTDRRRNRAPFNGEDRRVNHKRDDDPRHTRVGRVLRRYSIDELPQLINVLKGDMSIVGPRPELSTVVDQVDAREHARHLVRPGITGLWQVTQRQDGRPLAEDFDEDLVYVHRLGPVLDLRIIAKTFKVVVAGSGR